MKKVPAVLAVLLGNVNFVNFVDFFMKLQAFENVF